MKTIDKKELIDNLVKCDFSVMEDKDGEWGAVGSIHLYDKRLDGKMTVHPYVATIQLSTNGYFYNSEKYDSVEELRIAIEQHIKTLPYYFENYDPSYYKQVFVQLCLEDYIISLGFKGGGYGELRNYWKILDIYNHEILGFQLQFCEDKNKTDGEVTIHHSQFNHTSCSFTDLESGFGAINSIVIPKILTDIGINLNAIDKLNNFHNFKNLKEVELTMSGFTITDIKEKTIELLEKTLKELKGEL